MVQSKGNQQNYFALMKRRQSIQTSPLREKNINHQNADKTIALKQWSFCSTDDHNTSFSYNF